MHSYLQLIITVLSLNVSMFYVYTTILLCMQHVRGLQALCCTINLT